MIRMSVMEQPAPARLGSAHPAGGVRHNWHERTVDFRQTTRTDDMKPSPLRRDGNGPASVMAIAEMSPTVFRNPPGSRHVVRLSAAGRSVIVAGGLSKTVARRVAVAINDLLSDVLETPAPKLTACPQCAADVPLSGHGRPAIYCSSACRQRAYRDRQRG
jgi:hypothetical protein